jgi:hypothetical protein
MLLSLSHLGMYLISESLWASKLLKLYLYTLKEFIALHIHCLHRQPWESISYMLIKYFKLQSQRKKNVMYSSSLCRISKHYIYNIYERSWYSKHKRSVKFVQGMPHLCPCHQPNPKRGLVTYTRWITTKSSYHLCHTIKYGIIIHLVSLNTQTTTCSLAIWTLCDQKLR